MRSIRLITGTAILLASASAVPASAATLLFELTGSNTASFTLQSDPVVPNRINNQPLLSGSQIFFDGVSGTFGGVAGTADVNFGSGPIIAALNINRPGFSVQLGGTDLFSFVNGRPVFNLGTFAFSGIVTGPSTLRISQVGAAAVPEPATWAIMVLAFGLVGGALRRAKREQALTVSYS